MTGSHLEAQVILRGLDEHKERDDGRSKLKESAGERKKRFTASAVGEETLISTEGKQRQVIGYYST